MREEKFDFMKGILIFFVVWGHCISFFCTKENGNIYDFLWIFIYSFHMPLFVFISGYFAYNNVQRNFKVACINSLKHLIIPQIIYVLISFFIIFITSPKYDFIVKTNDSFDIKKIYHFVTLAWYLWCVFFCLIFTNILFHITNDFNKVFIISIIVFIIMNVFFEYLPGPIFKNQQFSRQLIFYVAGLFYRQKKQLIENKKNTIFIISFICYVILSINYKFWWNYYYKVVWFLFSVPVFYFIFEYLYSLFEKVPKVCSFIKNNLGQNTLGIYLIHIFVFKFITMNFVITPSIIMYLFSFFLSVIVCILCLIFISFIKKYRIMKYLFLGE